MRQIQCIIRFGAYDRPHLDAAEASKLATILANLRQCLESADMERRVEDLEQLLVGGRSAGTAPPIRRVS